MSKVSRGNKGESLVKKTLKKIKEYHKVLNDFTYVNEKTGVSHQVDHILIHPHGVFVIETKNYYGTIISDTGDVFWMKVVKGERSIISNPIKQNKSHTLLINKLLDKQYETISVVVFVKNNAPYVGDHNVINLKDLLLLVDTHPYKALLEKKDIDFIYKKLKSVHCDITKQEHLDNIDKLKAKQQIIRDDMAFAIETRTCPICGNKITIKGDEYFCNKCKYKFNISK